MDQWKKFWRSVILVKITGISCICFARANSSKHPLNKLDFRGDLFQKFIEEGLEESFVVFQKKYLEKLLQVFLKHFSHRIERKIPAE